MSTTPIPLDSAAAVRLARLAEPDKPWTESTDLPGLAYYEIGLRKPVIGSVAVPQEMDFFDLDNLNALAACEQRVVAAGLGNEYAAHLSNIVAADEGTTWNRLSLYALATATATQRARALLALLDAHPELEESK